MTFENSNNSLGHKDKVKRAEIKLAVFFAEHNIAFYTADHLIPLLKNICLDSTIAQDLTLCRKKCTNIVTNVIAKRESNSIFTNLQIFNFD